MFIFKNTLNVLRDYLKGLKMSTISLLKEIDKLLYNNVIFHIYENERQIYLACYENNKLIVSRNGKGYISTIYNFYTFLKKLNAIKLKKVDHIEYIIYCEYFLSKVLIIQKYWKQFKIYRKKKLWNRIGLKLLIIISPHLGNPELPGVKQKLLLNF